MLHHTEASVNGELRTYALRATRVYRREGWDYGPATEHRLQQAPFARMAEWR